MNVQQLDVLLRTGSNFMVEFRFADYWSPPAICYWRYTLWRSQYYCPEQMRALQWKHLSRLIRHCQRKVSYYRDLFQKHRLDVRSLEDLSRVPVLDKETVRSRLEEFKADDFKRYRPREIHTAGSTGTPMRVYWDIGSNILELTCQWRHFSWLGYRLGDVILDLRGGEHPGHTWRWKCRLLEISADSVNASDIQRWIDLLRSYKPTLWRGHSLSIYSFCRVMAEAGIEEPKPRAIATVAEPLLQSQREFIESFTGVKVGENYGLKEHTALIIQCPQGGYHIASEYGILEILKPNGDAAKPGEEGRIVTTGLHNRAFPLLRYDSGDLAIPSDRVCPCGRTLPLVERITGREDDYILDSRGRWVSGLRFALWNKSGIRLSQLIQSKAGSLDVYLVTTQEYTDQMGQEIIQAYKERLSNKMQINIRLVDQVPVRDTPKFKFVICKLDRNTFSRPY